MEEGLSLAMKVRVKVTSVKAFGAIPLAGGNTCQTKSLSALDLKATSPFDPIMGSASMSGTFSISDLNGCGPLNGLVSPLVAGDGNEMALSLSKTLG